MTSKSPEQSSHEGEDNSALSSFNVDLMQSLSDKRNKGTCTGLALESQLTALNRRRAGKEERPEARQQACFDKAARVEPPSTTVCGRQRCLVLPTCIDRVTGRIAREKNSMSRLLRMRSSG